MDESTEQRLPRGRLLVFPDQDRAIPGYTDLNDGGQRGIVRLLNVVGHLQHALPIIVKMASIIAVSDSYIVHN